MRLFDKYFDEFADYYPEKAWMREGVDYNIPYLCNICNFTLVDTEKEGLSHLTAVHPEVFTKTKVRVVK